MLCLLFDTQPTAGVFQLLDKYTYNLEYSNGKHVVSIYGTVAEKILEQIKEMNSTIEEKTDFKPFFTLNKDQDKFQNMDYEMSTSSYFPPPNKVEEPKVPMPQTPVTEELEEKLGLRITQAVNDAMNQLNASFKNDMAEQMKQLQILSAQSTPVRSNDQFQSSSSAPPSARPVQNVAQMFAPKNEVVANGLKCEKCLRTLKAKDVATLVDSLRTHVLEHFEQKCKHFKRFRCRNTECQMMTNHVTEIERHLARHGTLMRLPERRARLVEQLMSQEYLDYLAEMAHECYPEVFEDIPQSLANIEVHTAPLRSFRNVFPHLLRDFCSRYSVRDTRMDMRRSVPQAVINLD